MASLIYAWNAPTLAIGNNPAATMQAEARQLGVAEPSAASSGRDAERAEGEREGEPAAPLILQTEAEGEMFPDHGPR